MTKKVSKKFSKKNLLCLFPKSGNQSIKGSMRKLVEKNYPPVPDITSDWQAHYDYLEIAGWGSGLFGAPMDKGIEAIALRAVQLALQSGDKYKIAKSYRHLFYLYCEFKHPDSLIVGGRSVAAAVKAYGHSTAEVGEEVSMLSVVHEFNNNHDRAINARDAAIKIFEKGGTTERLFEALEIAICSASDLGRGDKVEEYARQGIRAVKKRCQKDSDEYIDNMEYFEQMLAAAHDPPVPIEVQQRQLFAMFPNLQKVAKGKR